MAPRKSESTPPITSEPSLKGYKAYDENLRCRDFQYEIGTTYHIPVDKHPIRCGSVGFHWCENPLDIWRYYDITNSRFTTVEATGEHSRDASDTKVASATITIGLEIELPEIIQRGVKWMLDFCKRGVSVDDKDGSRLAASGNDSSLAASGNDSSLAASGYGSRLVASGNDSRLAASGNGSSLAASGYGSRLAASGNGSRLVASGNGSRLVASGNGSRLAASGNGSSLAASGNDSSVKLGENGCASLAWNDGRRSRFTVIYVGENGIEADVWYRLDAAGKPVRAT